MEQSVKGYIFKYVLKEDIQIILFQDVGLFIICPLIFGLFV